MPSTLRRACPTDTSGLDCSFYEGSLNTTTISVEMVCTKLKRLKIFTSPGPDGIPAQVLKHCAEVLATPLSMLFNRSLVESHVPGGWKLATITPIFKKGDRTDPNNYRPAALLPIISKVMECVLDDLIRQYLSERQLMSLHQHGFVRGRSCLTNLLHCHEEWGHLIENHQGVDVIFLDLSKAFDLVPYHNLLQKLQSLGFGGSLLYWIRDYLTGCSFRVKVNGTLSDPMDVTSGVPQGSILGPLLFLLFMNDLPERITSSCILYADDVKIWGPSDDPVTLQQSLLTLQNWVSENGMVLNTSKCKVLPICTPAQNRYYLGDELLPTSNQEKDLGSIISPDLSSSANCREMAVRASRALNLLLRSLGKFQKTSFTRIYTSYVRAHLELNIQAYPPILSRDSLVLERVQRRATKRVKGLTGKSYPERLKTLDLFSLAFRRLRGDMILTHKILMHLDHPNRSILTLRDDDCLRGHRLTLQ